MRRERRAYSRNTTPLAWLGLRGSVGIGLRGSVHGIGAGCTGCRCGRRLLFLLVMNGRLGRGHVSLRRAVRWRRRCGLGGVGLLRGGESYQRKGKKCGGQNTLHRSLQLIDARALRACAMHTSLFLILDLRGAVAGFGLRGAVVCFNVDLDFIDFDLRCSVLELRCSMV